VYSLPVGVSSLENSLQGLWRDGATQRKFGTIATGIRHPRRSLDRDLPLHHRRHIHGIAADRSISPGVALLALKFHMPEAGALVSSDPWLTSAADT
jgi:hypothetical protein